MSKYEALNNHTLSWESHEYGQESHEYHGLYDTHLSHVVIFNFEAGRKTSVTRYSDDMDEGFPHITQDEKSFHDIDSVEIKQAYEILVEKLAETGRKPSFRCISA
jgi:hypothetical protein